MTPDIEMIVGDHLRGVSDIEAIVGDRVVGRTPSRSTDAPWVRVFQIDAPPAGRSTTDYLTAFYLQLDCFAGGEANGARGEVSDLVRAVRSALVAMRGTYGEAVVSGVRIDGCPRAPDRDFDPPMERYALTVTVWAHSA